MGNYRTGQPVKWVVAGDTQCPFHDPVAVELAAQLIEYINPHHLIYNGDMIDFWSISKHNPRRYEIQKSLPLQEEIDRTIQVQDILSRGTRKNCKRHIIDGNHEDRLERFLGTGTQASLGSLKSLTMESVFNYEQRGFSSYRPYGEGIDIIPGLFVYHGEYVGSLPGDSVKKEIAHRGSSIIMNHVHRAAEVIYRKGDDTYCGIENGCLCQISSGYKAMTNWTQCITLVKVYNEGEYFDTQLINFAREEDVMRAIYDGYVFEVPLDYHDGLAVEWRAHKNISWE